MPYEIRMQGDKHCVFNKDTGDNKGCSDSHSMAVKHMRALYAVETGKKKSLDDAYDIYSRQIEPNSAEYNAVGGDQTKACANCNWFSSPDGCILVSGDISPTGICNMWREKQIYTALPMPVVIVDKDVGCACLSCVATDDSGPYQIKAKMTRASINDLPDSSFAYIEPGCDTKSCRHFPIHDKAHVRNALARLSQSPFGAKASAKVHAAAKRMGIQTEQKKSLLDVVLGPLRQLHPPVHAGNAIILTKEASNLRVIMRVSNMFKDRHGEIITSEAHKEYVAWVDDDAERMPEFWLWHTKGTRWGRADGLAFDDSGYLVATGLVDNGMEYVAEALADTKNIGVSHGFFGFGLNKGYIDLYRSFEFSPLPLDQAANVWTAYMLAKEADLPIPEAKRKFFIEELGIPEAYITRVEAENKEESAAIKALGISYKEDTDGQISDSDDTDKSNSDRDSATQTEPTLADILAKLDGIVEDIGNIKAKQREFETKNKDIVASTLEAAIISGKGYVPSQAKDNASKPDDAASQKTDWFKDVVIDPLVTGRV